MDQLPYGTTGLAVSRLGFGAGALGDHRVAEAERLLHAAIDAGVTLFDTARSYGASEERLGRMLGARRNRLVLSTKGGYGVEGVADWTAGAIERGIDDALGRLRTDRIDIFHLHSCPLEILERGDTLAALERARDAGKIRVAAYSGEGSALAWAVAHPTFGGLQCSVSPFDQQTLRTPLPAAAARGLGLLAKRPLGNAPWRFEGPPAATDVAIYWWRMRRMELAIPAPEWPGLALRFTAFSPGVASILVGTTSLPHLRDNLAHLARGPLPAATQAELQAAFTRHDDGTWNGVI
jgi:aryl-alcohol dehydrogenase-like predicted oxidoreductase